MTPLIAFWIGTFFGFTLASIIAVAKNRESPIAQTFSKSEWREVSRIARPDLTDEEFEVQWEEFVQMKESA